MFRKDWFAISKLIFHFLEYYDCKNGWTRIDRIKHNIRELGNYSKEELSGINIKEAARILGIGEKNGVYAAFTIKFQKLSPSDMRLILSGGPR